ncbi:hypothetical protein BXZ70DRAFT_946982 [Cristinia sonorae]|uniref:F-box domain-containing protein n=1 Tax=Cristinia sonorae TaxID=1940300 RepID=A0A8K0UKK9_9AGAR|nr:hypothetical protein BXZ70DRAFT_946982 [Cristinia sonorae]
MSSGSKARSNVKKTMQKFKRIASGSGSISKEESSNTVVNVPPIPEDLVADITEHLSGDNQTLKACSRVSKTWSYHARKPLFRTLVVRPGPAPTNKRFTRFHNFIQSNPTIASCIKQLELASLNLDEPARNTNLAQVNTSLVHLLEKLPNLQRLILNNISLAGSPPEHGVTPFPLHSLKCINISSTTTQWFCMLQHIVCKELYIQMDPINDAPRAPLTSDTPAEDIPHLPITSLSLVGVDSPALQHAVVPLLEENSLQSLYAATYRTDQLHVVGAMIAKSERSLHSLHIDMSALRDRAAYLPNTWEQLKLKSCSALTSITITFHLGIYTGATFAILHTLLLHSPPSLKYLNVFLTLHRATSGDVEKPAIERNILGETCARIDSLVETSVKGLDSLVFDLRDHMNPYTLPYDAWMIITESMPQLHKKGVLKVHPRFKNALTSPPPSSNA